MKRSVSLTINASPAGSQDTMEGSSLFSMSISLRGKGFDPGDGGVLEADNAGDIFPADDDDVRVIRRVDGRSVSLRRELSEVEDTLRLSTLMTPLPLPLDTGTRNLAPPCAGADLERRKDVSGSSDFAFSKFSLRLCCCTGRACAARKPAKYMARN